MLSGLCTTPWRIRWTTVTTGAAAYATRHFDAAEVRNSDGERARAPAGGGSRWAGRAAPPPPRVDPRRTAEQARVLRAARDGQGAPAPHRMRERELPEHRRVLDPP